MNQLKDAESKKLKKWVTDTWQVTLLQCLIIPLIIFQ